MRIYEGYDCVNIPEVGFNGYIMFPKDEYQVKKHPVLYLFHGTGGVEEWFCSSKGNMPEFMNEWVESSPNNIPMIVVFPKVSNCTYATEYVQYQKPSVLQFLSNRCTPHRQDFPVSSYPAWFRT